MHPKLSITNNEGYTFSCERDHNRSTIHIEKHGRKYGKADKIILDGLHPSRVKILTNAKGFHKKALVESTLKGVLKKLAHQAEQTSRGRTYGVQFYQQRGQKIVVIGPYGLQGGGLKQTAAFVTGAAKVAGGIWVTAVSGGNPLALPLATGMISSGAGDMHYAFKTPEIHINFTDYSKQSSVTFLGGAAGGGAGLVAAPYVVSFGVWGAHIASSAANNLANTVVSTLSEAVIIDHAALNKFTPGNILKSAAVGVVTGSANNFTKGPLEDVGKRLINTSINNAVIDTALKATVGGAAGAVGGASAKMVENGLRKFFFIHLSYNAIPDPASMEQERLYLFVHDNQVRYRYKNQRNEVVEVGLSEALLISKSSRDGNSLFQAVSHQLVWSGMRKESSAQGVRQALMTYLDRNWSLYQKYQTNSETKAQYLERMGKAGEGGSKLELQALADLFQVQIHVVMNRSRVVYGDKKNPIFNLDFKERFYNSLVKNAEKKELEKLKTLLMVNGKIRIDEKQLELIYAIATRHGHLPTSLWNGVRDAAIMGAASGAVIGATNAYIDRMRAEQLREAREKEQAARAKVEEEEEVEHTDKKPRVEEEEVQEEPQFMVIPPNPDEIAQAQAQVSLFTLVYNNCVALAGYSTTDMENVGNNIFNNARNNYTTQADQIANMEQQLFDLYGIPIGTCTNSLQNAITAHKPGKAVPMCIQGILQGVQQAGSGIAQAQAALNQANTNLANAQQPKVVPVEKPSANEVIPPNPTEIAQAEAQVNKQTVVYNNCVTLSTYTTVDMENVGNNIFNNARNNYTTQADQVKNMEQQLYDLYGIPVGTSTDSLVHAFYSKNPGKAVPMCIQGILLGVQQAGSGIPQAEAALNQANGNLASAQQPRVATNNATPAPTFNILELVTDSENHSNTVGAHRNPYVQMRYLAAQLAGSSTSELYNQIYFAYVDAYNQWNSQPNGPEKPTQYGFLTSVTDQLVNGTSTVQVEMPSYSILQKGLNIINTVNAYTDTPITPGIGVQATSTKVTAGTMNHPDLITLWSNEPSKGVEGFQLPAHVPPGPAVMDIPVPTPNVVDEPPPVDNPPKPNPAVNVAPPPPAPKPPATNTPPAPQPFLSTTSYVTIDVAQRGVSFVDKLPHVQGLGTYASRAVTKVMLPIVGMDYYQNSTHQTAPKKHRLLCAAAATATDYGVTYIGTGAGTLMGGPVGGLVAVGPASYAGNKAGEFVQKTCHNMMNKDKN